MGYFWGWSRVRQLFWDLLIQLSNFLSILTFEFNLNLGSFFTFGALMGYFWCWVVQKCDAKTIVSNQALIFNMYFGNVLYLAVHQNGGSNQEIKANNSDVQLLNKSHHAVLFRRYSYSNCKLENKPVKDQYNQHGHLIHSSDLLLRSNHGNVCIYWSYFHYL